MARRILVVVAMAALALSAPAGAGAAEWTENGKPLTANKQIVFNGTFRFEHAEFGGEHCPAKVTTTIELEKGTLKGKLKSIVADTFFTCEAFGFIAAVCGKNSLTQMVFGGGTTATGTLGSKAIDLEGFQATYTYGTCLTVKMTGNLSLDIDSETGITSGALTGSVESNFEAPFQYSGSSNASPSGVYGMK